MLPNLPQREEFLRKKRKKKIIKYAIFLGIFIFVVALASFLSHRSSIRVSNVELSGGVLVTESEVEKVVLEYLEGSYLWLFPKNNSFWYSRKNLMNHLKDNFKRIDTVDLNLKNFKVLSVKIVERKPTAIWCDQSFLIETEEKEYCYFMDQNSTIFAEAPQFSGDAYFKYYGLIESENPVGSEFMASSTQFAELVQFAESVKSLLFHPQYIIAKGGGEFSMKLSGGGEIYFDTKKPLQNIFENLSTLLQTPIFANASTASLPVEYIDLRYGNKLFYKLK